jgi:hypothetical protein
MKRGIFGWFRDLEVKMRARRLAPRLEVVERIALGPRQSLVLVEADGRRLLVATSAEGGAAFYALDASGIDTPAIGTPGIEAPVIEAPMSEPAVAGGIDKISGAAAQAARGGQMRPEARTPISC